MRRIINSTYITLDGVIANPQDWPSSEVPDDAAGVIQTELLFGCDSVLIKTGDVILTYRPAQKA